MLNAAAAGVCLNLGVNQISLKIFRKIFWSAAKNDKIFLKNKNDFTTIMHIILLKLLVLERLKMLIKKKIISVLNLIDFQEL